jgi:hypothetical protein
MVFFELIEIWIIQLRGFRFAAFQSMIFHQISTKHSSWEVDKSRITIKEKIGEGNFGFVLLGLMPNEFGIIQSVAIKTIKEQGISCNIFITL